MARAPGSSVPLLFLLVLGVVAAAFFFLMSHQETEAGAANSFEISPASKNISVGSSGSMNLVADPGADSLAVWIVKIGFDPKIVTFSSCTSVPSPAGASAGSGCQAFDDDTVVSYGGVLFSATERGFDDETILATVRFDAVGAIGECSDLTIDVRSNLGPDPDGVEGDHPVVANGKICIVEIGYAPAVVRGNAWHLRNSNTGGVADNTFTYGRRGDTHLMCDWNGDGVRTPGVVRGNIWHLRNSNNGGASNVAFAYGIPGDIPICGDWDGSLGETPGVVRGNTWHLRNRNTGGVADVTFTYGRSGDIPLVWKASVPTQ